MSHIVEQYREIMVYIILKYYDQYLRDKSHDAVKPKQFDDALPDILTEYYKITLLTKESQKEQDESNAELIRINNDLLDEFLEMDSYLNELD